MAAHTFAKANTWFTGRTTLKRINFTKITIVNSYTSTGSETASWDASEDTDGSVMVYVTGSGSNLEMIIVGDNGSGRIYTNDDATTMFGYVSGDYFKNVTAIDGLDILDTSGTTIMTKMFQVCLSVKTLDLRNFDTSKVRYMNQMFMSNGTFGALKLEEIYGLENFDVSNVTTFMAMFSCCANLKSLDLSKWKVSSACTTLRQMFDKCENLEYIRGISDWDVSNVTDLQGVFQYCKNLREIDLSGWKSSVSAARLGMFNETIRLEKITVGPEFVIHTTDMDAPSSEYIEGADGYWYTIGGRPYSKDAIPSEVAATYYASPLLIRDIPVLVKNGVLIDVAKTIRDRENLTDDLKPSEFRDELERVLDSEYPTLSASFLSKLTHNVITNVTFATSYTETGNEIKVWNADSQNTGAIKGYQIKTKVVIVSTTGDPIRLDPDSANLFAGMKFLNEINGWENVDTSHVRLFDGAFANCECLKEIDLSELSFPSLESYEKLFLECGRLERISMWQGLTSVMQGMFNKCISLKTITGLGNITSIGDMSFVYTSKLEEVDIDASKIESVGKYATRLSNIEDLVDLSAVSSVDEFGTRAARWGSKLGSIQNFFEVNSQYNETIYLDTPNTESQLLYPDVPMWTDPDGTILYVTLVGCGYMTIYHEWNNVYNRYDPDKVYPNFITWWNDQVLKDRDGNPYDFVGLSQTSGLNRMDGLLKKLGWNVEAPIFVQDVEPLSVIAERLHTKKLPIFVFMHSAAVPDGAHAVLITGMNPKTRKLAILDPHGVGDTGTVSWVHFEDLFMYDPDNISNGKRYQNGLDGILLHEYNLPEVTKTFNAWEVMF